MDKNTIIGIVLMIAVFVGFTIMNKPSDEEIAKQKEQARRDSITYARNLEESAKFSEPNTKITEGEKKIAQADDFFTVTEEKEDSSLVFDPLLSATEEEKIYTLENEKLKIEISSKGGQVISTQIKNYKAYNKTEQTPIDSVFLFDRDAQISLILTNTKGKQLSTSDLNFHSVGTTNEREITMRYAYGDKQYVDFVYMLDDYFLKYHIQMVGMKEVVHRDTEGVFQLAWNQKMRLLEKSAKNEQQNSSIRFKRNTGDVDGLSETKDEEKEISESTKWLAFKNQFFASVLIADDKFENLVLNSKITERDSYLKSYDAMIYMPSKVDISNNLMSAGMTFYFGPLGFSHLASFDDGKADNEKLTLDELVPLGWAPLRVINKYFVIPVFNLLSSTGMGIGIVILLLTVIVKIIISPLTYKSFMSSAKMRVLKPQVEELSAKFPKQEQAMEKQQAVMALYNKAGANPMAGCIPMLLQMPVLIALFRFFPNAIELRQQSFLWAKDLSTYDAIVTFPSIPLLGDHLSLFCILMTITNVIYAKFNMQMTSTGQDQMPGMKWMMYLMPVAFLFILNDFPSGLTYYYFVSLLITILLTLLFRFFVDEEKVLAKLEANKAKPKKKSGFMARLEEAQRMQQQQMKQQNKKKR